MTLHGKVTGILLTLKVKIDIPASLMDGTRFCVPPTALLWRGIQ